MNEWQNGSSGYGNGQEMGYGMGQGPGYGMDQGPEYEMSQKLARESLLAGEKLK